MFFVSFQIYSQDDLKFNKIDSSITFSFEALSNISDTIVALQNENSYIQDSIVKLEKEILILSEMRNEQDAKIIKLEKRDTIYNAEIAKYKVMDGLMREKLFKANDVIDNYKILLYSTEDLLRVESKKAKNATIWKNVYKYAYPAIGLIAAVLILK
jgi:flagellar motor component MotA